MMSLPRPSTPKKVSSEIYALCADLDIRHAKPVFVDVRPLPGAVQLDCFPTVIRHVETNGGSICHGWRFWGMPDIFVEAEFHAVWRRPDESLLDISPNQAGDDRVLFIPDPNRVYDGRQRNNVRRALTTHPAIHDFFRAADRTFEIYNLGKRAMKSMIADLSPSEVLELHELENLKISAYLQIASAKPRPGRNDLCPCGSGVKYKRCHGR